MVYFSESLNRFSDILLSVQKTYSEGIDVIRTIHQNENKYVVVSSIESRVSGPSEYLEETINTYEEAETALIKACKEDDEFYN